MHRLMIDPSLWPTAQNEGFSRYASSICARDTRLASSILDRQSVVKVAISSSLIAHSTARRHPAMIQLLVAPTENEESANNPSVPPISLLQERRLHGIGRLDPAQASAYFAVAGLDRRV
ncbi:MULTISPECIES: hypothetical protein [unclassified Bradyrhizobium]